MPVFKKRDKSSVEDYRPISLTSLVMKVFERCVKTALFAACEDVLDPRQHGFLTNRSCVTQMIPFAHDLASTINDKSRSDVIYFDFAKAFDSVSHDVILSKLKTQYSIDGKLLIFLRNYLKGRYQRVVQVSPLSSIYDFSIIQEKYVMSIGSMNYNLDNSHKRDLIIFHLPSSC